MSSGAYKLVCEQRTESATKLQAAVSIGSIAIVELLFKFGADVRVQCDYPGSLLHQAAWRGARNIAELLVAHGADIHLRNQSKNTPLDIALGQGQPEIIQYLSSVNATANYSSLSGGPQDYQLAVIRFCQGKDGGINQRFKWDGNQYSFFTLAVRLGHWKIAKLLHGKGGKHYSSDKEMTLLHYSTFVGCVDTARFVMSLPEGPAALNQFTHPHSGATPLGLAAYNGYTGLVRFFIESGANIDLMNSFGENALKKAFGHPRFAAIQLLIDMGANGNLINKPYPKYWEDWRREYNEKCLIINSIVDLHLVKLLASYIEIEYYRLTNDSLCSAVLTLLDRLIKRFAGHAAPLIMKEKYTRIKELILEMIDRLEISFEGGAKEKEEYAEKLQKECQEILENSLVNRLESIFHRPPGYLMNAYLSFHLAFNKPFTFASIKEMDPNQFFKDLSTLLEAGPSSLYLFVSKLTDFDCSLYLPCKAKPKPKPKPKQKTESKESEEEKGIGEIIELKEREDVKESEDTKKQREVIIRDLKQHCVELHERRLDLSNSIMNKFLAKKGSQQGHSPGDSKSGGEKDRVELEVNRDKDVGKNKDKDKDKRKDKGRILSTRDLFAQILCQLEKGPSRDELSQEVITSLMGQLTRNISPGTLFQMARLLMNEISVDNVQLTRNSSREEASSRRPLTPLLTVHRGRAEGQEAKESKESKEGKEADKPSSPSRDPLPLESTIAEKPLKSAGSKSGS